MVDAKNSSKLLTDWIKLSNVSEEIPLFFRSIWTWHQAALCLYQTDQLYIPSRTSRRIKLTGRRWSLPLSWCQSLEPIDWTCYLVTNCQCVSFISILIMIQVIAFVLQEAASQEKNIPAERHKQLCDLCSSLFELLDTNQSSQVNNLLSIKIGKVSC